MHLTLIDHLRLIALVIAQLVLVAALNGMTSTTAILVPSLLALDLTLIYLGRRSLCR